jgi:BirA family biotin operon repressor/biotin-[acetyl-CoA-carboxylase] ligase
LWAVVHPLVDDVEWRWVPGATPLGGPDGVRRSADVDPRLKWPNDLLLTSDHANGKFAGILLERVANPSDRDRPLAVIGIGINVGMTREQLPVPTATSLAIAGARAGRTEVFGAVVASLSHVLSRLAEDPEAVLDQYRGACTTIGRRVEVHLPDGTVFTGHAEDVDEHGRLVVDGKPVGAGDVVHVRPDVT